MRIFIATGLATLVVAVSSAQIRTPLGRLPTPRGIPGVDRILNNPPLTTGGDDAWLEAPPLDGYTPASFESLQDLPRDSEGRFKLRPGAFAMDAESYCLHIGTRGPVTGDGYLSAPLKGGRADAIRSILRNAGRDTDIPQGDIQVLIWSLLARVEVNELNPKLRGIAARLLTPQELRSVSDSPWDLLDTSAGRRIIRELPAPARQALNAERRVRDMVRKVNYDYKQLERIAMTPTAVLPKDAPRVVGKGRWMQHPNGFFIRYASSGYPRTRVEIVVPDRYTYKRDSLGRILSLSDEKGNRIETDYDDSITPLTVPADPRLAGYAFRSIRFIRTTAAGPETHEIRNKGWTFVRRRPAAARRQPALMRIGLFTAAQGGFEGWKERYDAAREWYDRYQYYRERGDRMRAEPDDSAIDDLENNEHYREGTDAALGGDTGERLDWIIQQKERERDALRRAIIVIGELPTDSTADPSYGPWDDVAVPTRPGSQRLGISGR